MKQFLTFLESFVIVALVAAGILGLTYHVFRAGGWFDAAFERLAEIVFQNVTASFIIGTIALVLFVMWHERRVTKGVYNRRLPTIVLYVLMAAGVFFIGRYALVGSF